MSSKAQTSFFDQTQEDSPSLAAQPPRAKVAPFIAKPKARQETFAECHACKDTGKIGYQACWCDCQPSQDRSRVIRDALSISSGTIANLIGDSQYDAIDAAQNQFIGWLEATDKTFKNWQEAWEIWAKSK